MTEPDRSFKRLQWNVSGPGHLYYITIDGGALYESLEGDLRTMKTVDLAVIQELCRQTGIKAQRELDRRANDE